MMRLLATLLLSGMVFLAVGCDRGQSPVNAAPNAGAATGGGLKIGIIVPATDALYHDAICRAAQEAARKQGAVIIRQTAASSDQVQDALNTLGAFGASGVMVCAADPTDGDAIVATAGKHHMKLLAIEEQLTDVDGKVLRDVHYMGMAPSAIGSAVAQALTDEMKKRGWALADTGGIGITSDEIGPARQQAEATREALMKMGLPETQIFMLLRGTPPSRVASYAAASDVVATHPGVKHFLVFSSNDDGVLGAVRALDTKKLGANDVIGVGVGGTSGLAELHRADVSGFVATLVTDGKALGAAAADGMIAWLRDNKEPATAATASAAPSTLVTRGNLAEVAEAQGLDLANGDVRDMKAKDWDPQPMLVTKMAPFIDRSMYPVIDVHNHLGNAVAFGPTPRRSASTQPGSATQPASGARARSGRRMAAARSATGTDSTTQPATTQPVRPLYSRVLTAERVDQYLAEMDAANIKTVINLDGYYDNRLTETLKLLDEAHPGRFLTFARLNFQGVDDPDWGDREAKRLEEGFKAGAKGLKIAKDLGLGVRFEDGTLLKPNDPKLDGVWEMCGKYHRPVMIHIADPAAFFTPLDDLNERWHELNEHPDWAFFGPKYRPRMELLNELCDLTARHPNTTFMWAHMGNNVEDLGWVGEKLDKYPNMMVDIDARISELGRQPYTARDFFIKYQDRIMFGTDTPPDRAAFRVYFRFLETKDEYFDCTASHHLQGFWRIYGIYLPPEILEKVYYKNAERVLGLTK